MIKLNKIIQSYNFLLNLNLTTFFYCDAVYRFKCKLNFAAYIPWLLLQKKLWQVISKINETTQIVKQSSDLSSELNPISTSATE